MNGFPDREAEPAGRGRIRSLLQRLFFPDEAEKEQLMLDLFEDLQQCGSTSALCKDFGSGLWTALQPDHLHVFTRHSERMCLRWSSSRSLDPKVVIPSTFRLPEVAREWPEPKALEGLPSLPAEERQWLRSWGARWLVPIARPGTGRDLTGLILIGDRSAGLNTVQRDLLMGLAGRMAERHVRLTQDLIAELKAQQGQGHWLKECPECSRCFGREVFFCPDDDAATEPTILAERLVDGRYLLEKKLGRGGMGAVYRATDQKAGRDVALKVLTGGDTVAMQRFANESMVGRTIDHPVMTEVLDSGSFGRQGAYMVMEFVAGRTLRSIYDEEAPIEPARLGRWFDQVLEGVQHAHSKGIVHRDLKPDNIMVTDDDSIKLLDFGLAKLRGSTQAALTAAGMVIGTLSYMSPEQLAADDVDHRTDLFALGVMVSEGLTGRLPFYAENLGKMLQAVATQPYRLDITSAEQGIVADVLGKALSKAPGERFEDVESFRQALIPALAQAPKFV